MRGVFFGRTFWEVKRVRVGEEQGRVAGFKSLPDTRFVEPCHAPLLFAQAYPLDLQEVRPKSPWGA